MTVKKQTSLSSKKLLPEKHERSITMLRDFGLTENEARIYTYLLERGTEAGGSKISVGTKMHRHNVYNRRDSSSLTWSKQ